MQAMKSAIAAVMLALFTGQAQASLFVITNDIVPGGAQYVGSSPFLGYVNDGGFDAFDGFGYYSSGIGPLSIQRQVDAISSLNTYRWLDTFTNSSASSVTQQVVFYGNLGSDGSETIIYNDGSLIVSRDGYGGPASYDPVLSLLNGNNAWALANMTLSLTGDAYRVATMLTLDPGASVSLLYFASLTRPNDIGAYYDAASTGSIASAVSVGLNLKADPLLTGLSSQQIESIVNFSSESAPVVTPEPTSLALAGCAGLGMAVGAWRRRRLQKSQAA